MTTLCDSLENVLTCFLDKQDAMEDGVGSNIFKKLRTFKNIYLFFCGYFHIISMLSRLFQNKFVDKTTIGSVVKTNIVHPYALHEELSYLNSEIFNDQTEYHILPEFGPQG